jgi:hypothetical protein
MAVGSYVRKGFYTEGITSRQLYAMPSLPDNFLEKPVAGFYDGITIKYEGGAILFKQSELIAKGVITDPVMELVATQQ